MLASTINNTEWQVLLSHAMMCVKALCKFKACYKSLLWCYFREHPGRERCLHQCKDGKRYKDSSHPFLGLNFLYLWRYQDFHNCSWPTFQNFWTLIHSNIYEPHLPHTDLAPSSTMIDPVCGVHGPVLRARVRPGALNDAPPGPRAQG